MMMGLMMDRRSFIKAVGAVLVYPSLPSPTVPHRGVRGDRVNDIYLGRQILHGNNDAPRYAWPSTQLELTEFIGDALSNMTTGNFNFPIGDKTWDVNSLYVRAKNTGSYSLRANVPEQK